MYKLNSQKHPDFWEPSDIVTHEGDDYQKFGGAATPPIWQTSLFVTPSPANGLPDFGYSYTRASNPTVEVAEQKTAALEGGEDAVCFASGMAAISSVLFHYLQKDCHIIAVRDVYASAYSLLKDWLPARTGATVTFVDGRNFSTIAAAAKSNPHTRLIYLESPSSGVFTLQDLEKAGQFSRDTGIPVVIDSTWATPLGQSPLKYGIDTVIHSASKYLSGHSDIVGGVAVSSRENCASFRTQRMLLGGCMDPHQAWLMVRGMRTRPLRMQRHMNSALAVAKWLERQPQVEHVFYPGLASHPQQELIVRQMKGFSGLLSLVVKGGVSSGRAFTDRLRVFQKGCSWGGYESLVLPLTLGMDPQSCEQRGMPPNLIRLHVGLEEPDTLIADLRQALEGSAYVQGSADEDKAPI